MKLKIGEQTFSLLPVLGLVFGAAVPDGLAILLGALIPVGLAVLMFLPVIC